MPEKVTRRMSRRTIVPHIQHLALRSWHQFLLNACIIIMIISGNRFSSGDKSTTQHQHPLPLEQDHTAPTSPLTPPNLHKAAHSAMIEKIYGYRDEKHWGGAQGWIGQGYDTVFTHEAVPLSAQRSDLFNIPPQTRVLHHSVVSVYVGLESPAGSSRIVMKKGTLKWHICIPA